jgi:hypothetical protein
LLVIGGLSLGLGYNPIIGIAAVGLFLIEMINFTKNLALLGSTVMFLAIPQPWPYSIGH